MKTYAIQRRIKVSIQIRGQLKIYESNIDQQWDITCKFKKTTDATKNKGSVSIANLEKETRNYLLRETSPYNNTREKHLIIVEASYINQDYTRVFVGYITSATTTQGPDIYTTLQVETLGAESLDISVINYNQPVMSLHSICREVAAQLGVRLVYTANDLSIKNWTFSGSKARLIRKLNDIPSIDAYVDDDRLIVKNTGTPVSTGDNVLNQYNGMIGQPEVTELGCKVRTTFLPTARLGSTFRLDSMSNPSADGTYEIFEMDYQLSTRGDTFHLNLAAKRLGIVNNALVPTQSALADNQLLNARDGATEGLTRLLQPTSKPAATTNPTSSIITAIDRRISEAATQLPAMVVSYDRQRNVARVQGVVQRLTSDGGSVPESVIAEVPVLAYGGGGVSMTFPLVPGSLGWIEASQRDISAFMDTLATGPVPTNRTHDWGDSRFIPDAFRQFTLPQNVGGAFCLQSTDGSTYVSVKKGQVAVVSDNAVNVKSPNVTVDATTVTVKANDITLDAPTITANADTFNMNAQNFNMTAQGAISGDVDIKGVLTINGVRFNEHYHIGNQGKNTSGPQNA